MALRFTRTIDEALHMFSTREHADTDWLLHCGSWRVGHIHENLRPAGQHIVFAWSLTGPNTPEAPVALRGEAASIAGRPSSSSSTRCRAWAVWAGLRTAEGGGPGGATLLTKDARPDLLAPAMRRATG